MLSMMLMGWGCLTCCSKKKRSKSQLPFINHARLFHKTDKVSEKIDVPNRDGLGLGADVSVNHLVQIVHVPCHVYLCVDCGIDANRSVAAEAAREQSRLADCSTRRGSIAVLRSSAMPPAHLRVAGNRNCGARSCHAGKRCQMFRAGFHVTALHIGLHIT